METLAESTGCGDQRMGRPDQLCGMGFPTGGQNKNAVVGLRPVTGRPTKRKDGLEIME